MTSSNGNIFPRYCGFVRVIYRSPVNSPHKGQWRGALMFSLICLWINGSVNNCEAGDLRRHRTHYDIHVMTQICLWCSQNVLRCIIANNNQYLIWVTNRWKAITQMNVNEIIGYHIDAIVLLSQNTVFSTAFSEWLKKKVHHHWHLGEPTSHQCIFHEKGMWYGKCFYQQYFFLYFFFEHVNLYTTGHGWGIFGWGGGGGGHKLCTFVGLVWLCVFLEMLSVFLIWYGEFSGLISLYIIRHCEWPLYCRALILAKSR